MVSPEIPHSDLSNADIVNYCSDPNRQAVTPLGNVVKISDQAVVKYGDVYYEEA